MERAQTDIRTQQPDYRQYVDYSRGGVRPGQSLDLCDSRRGILARLRSAHGGAHARLTVTNYVR